MTNPVATLSYEAYAEWARNRPVLAARVLVREEELSSMDTIPASSGEDSCPPTVRSERGHVIIARDKKSV